MPAYRALLLAPLMLGLAAVLALPAAPEAPKPEKLPMAQERPVAPSLEGWYRVTGSNGEGHTYVGLAQLKKRGSTYRIVWYSEAGAGMAVGVAHTVGHSSLVAAGSVVEERFTIAVNYQIVPDKTGHYRLTGIFSTFPGSDKTGTEELTWLADFTAKEKE